MTCVAKWHAIHFEYTVLLLLKIKLFLIMLYVSHLTK